MSKTGWFVLAMVVIAVLGFENGSKVIGFGALWLAAVSVILGAVGFNKG